jgi:hypothetical protein
MCCAPARNMPQSEPRRSDFGVLATVATHKPSQEPVPSWGGVFCHNTNYLGSPLRAPQPGMFLAGAQHIRPETIVVFRNDGSSIGAPLQMGFENFRPTLTETHISLEIRIGRKTCIDIIPDKGSICRRCAECNTTSTVLGFAS